MHLFIFFENSNLKVVMDWFVYNFVHDIVDRNIFSYIKKHFEWFV